MTGHHACESDYDRPADAVPNPHGHDADDWRMAEEHVEHWPDDLLDARRTLMIELARGDGSGLDEVEQGIRDEACMACRGSGLAPKRAHSRRSGCNACRGTGAKPDTTGRRVVNELSLRYPRGGRGEEWRAPGTEGRGM